MTNNNGQSRTLQTVETSFEIVEFLRESRGARVTEIAEELNINLSTVHHHLATLKKVGYVQNEDGEYKLSLKFLTVGGEVRMHDESYRAIIEKTNELAYETGQRAQFIIEEQGKAVWVARSLGPDAILTNVRLGIRIPLHTIAAGKAILAHLPRERVLEIIDQYGLEAQTEHTITDKSRLLDELKEIRDNGYAVNDQERINLEQGIGVPINDPDEDLIGAVSISAPSRRWDENDLTENLPELLLKAKHELELSIAFD